MKLSQRKASHVARFPGRLIAVISIFMNVKCMYCSQLFTFRVVVYFDSQPNKRKSAFPACMTEFILMFTRGAKYITNPQAKFWQEYGFRNVISGTRPAVVRISYDID